MKILFENHELGIVCYYIISIASPMAACRSICIGSKVGNPHG